MSQGQTNWGAAETVANDLLGVAGLSVAVDSIGSVHLVWTAFDSGKWLMYYAQRYAESTAPLDHKVYIPVLEQPGNQG